MILKDIPNTNGMYLASAEGHIISKSTFRQMYEELNTKKPGKGYYRVRLFLNGKMVKRLVHRLVMEAFKAGADASLQVNHINGIRTDNRIENLEWCTRRENALHSSRVLGKVNGLTGHLVLDKSTGVFYISVAEAAVARNVNRRKLHDMLTGKISNGTPLCIV